MRREKSKNEEFAVSQVISTLLVLSIVVSSIGTIMYWGLPYIDEQKMNSQKEALFSNFELIDNKVANLIISGPNSIGTGVIVNSNQEGNLNIDSESDKLVVMYSFDKAYNFSVTGLDDDDNEFKVFMNKGEGVTVPDDWYDNDPDDEYFWKYRQEIIINHDKVYDDFNNFPVLVKIDNIKPYQSDAGDVLFVNDTGYVLNYEIERYLKDIDELIFWVNITEISMTDDTRFYIYYYNENSSLNNLQNPDGVWNSDYSLVNHFHEDETISLQDSTKYSNDLNIFNSDFNKTAHWLTDGGFDCEENKYLQNNGLNFDSKSSITIECFIKFNALDSSQYIIELPDTVTGNNGPGIYFDQIENEFYYHMVTTGESSLTDVKTTDANIGLYNWHYLVLTYDASTLKGYYNGEMIDSDPVFIGAGIKHGSSKTYIGCFSETIGDYFKGTISEIRISDIARNDNWIKTSHNSMGNNFLRFENAQAIDGSYVLDDVEIIKLDPTIDEEIIKSKESSKYIYSNNKYFQKFKTPSFSDETKKLNKVLLEIGKVGHILDDLNVSIYENPASSELGQSSISANIVSYSIDWVECDFSSENIQLKKNTEYYIGLETHNTNSSNYKCYKWKLVKPSIYEEGCAYSYNPLRIIEDGDYDFKLRLFYEDINVPLAPKTLGFFNDYFGMKYWYSGVRKTVSLYKDDSQESDILYYKINWGDGTNTSWEIDNIQHEHIWKEPGTYELLGSCKNSYNIENYYDNKTYQNLFIYDGIAFPKDILDIDDVVNINNENIISSFSKLNGTFLINLYSKFYPSSNNYKNLVPFGRIWVFDLGQLEFDDKYSSGSQIVLYQNGAILFSTNKENSLKNEPAFIESDELIALRVIQLLSGYSSSGGGAGTYNLKIEMRNTHNRERPAYFTQDVSNFKLQFFGDRSDIWKQYFLSNYNFSIDPNYSNIIFYKENEKTLLLDNSIIEFNLEVIN